MGHTPTTNIRPSLRVVAGYVGSATLWILLSDRLLGIWLPDPGTLTRWSTYKGLAFVAVTAFLLTVLLHAELRIRQRHQSTIEQNEERLRLLGDNLPESYVFQYTQAQAETPRFLYVSAGVERLHGLSVSDVLGDARLLLRQFGPELEKAFLGDRLDGSGDLADMSLELPSRNVANEPRWVHLRARPRRLPGGRVIWDGVATDITARKQAQLASKEAERRLADIIEFLPDATFVIDPEKRVVAWNRACEVLTGVSKEAVMGCGDYAYAVPFFGERRPILIDLLDLPEASLEAEYKYVLRKGSLIYAESFLPRLNQGCGAHLWGVAGPLFDQSGQRSGAIEVIRDVTDQMRVEQALRENELKYRMLFETAGDAILLMRRDKFIDCNARALTMFGCTREQLIGAPPYEYSPPTQPDGRDSTRKALENIQAALAEGPQTFEWEHCRRDRTTFMAEVSLNRLDLEGETLLQAIVRDITGRKRTEARLSESERQYRELVEHANSIILRWNSEGVITFLNEFGLRFFGYPAAEILGRHISGTILPPTEAGGRDLSDLMEKIFSDPVAFEQNINENIRRNGERVWIAWTNKVVLDESGKVTEIMSIGTDITERKKANEKIRQLHQDLQRHAAELERRVEERTAELAEARNRAEAADRLKSAFLATMSHELRTPLNSIIGFTGIILQGLAGPLNEEQRKQLEMVRGSARHLLALINDVLDISKIEAGQLEVRCERFDLRTSIAKVTESIKPLAARKGLALTVDIADEITGWVSDQRRVEQILINLLNNAIKFTETGRVHLRAEMAAGALRISVTDTGIGIRAVDLQRLFQPFHQVDTGLTRNHEGTGLGLAICRRLADLLGGEVNAVSDWGKGSTFTLVLRPNDGVNR